MEIEFKLRSAEIIYWRFYLNKDEKKFAEETRQEIHLNLLEQYGGNILY